MAAYLSNVYIRKLCQTRLTGLSVQTRTLLGARAGANAAFARYCKNYVTCRESLSLSNAVNAYQQIVPDLNVLM